MQTGKIRRTVAKLQQLRDDFYAFPAADLTLWMVQRTDDSPRRKPPGMRALFCVFTVETLDCSYYVTADASKYVPPFLPSGLLPPDANELTNQKLSEMTQAFCSMIRRCDYLLKEANLIPEYSSDATLYAVTTLALNGDISTAKPYYWQGGTTFAASFAKDWPKSWTVPLSCLDWFVKIDELPEAVGDTIDELLTNLETVSDEQQPMPATIEQPAAKPSEPEGSETYRKLLSAYTNGASDAKLKAMATVIDGNGTVDEKTEKLNSLLSLSTLSGETIGKLLGCTKQAIFKTRYWKDNRADEISKRIESRRTRLTGNGKQYEPGTDDE